MGWVVVKSRFQVFLVPNYRAFRIPVKYVRYFSAASLLLQRLCVVFVCALLSVVFSTTASLFGAVFLFLRGELSWCAYYILWFFRLVREGVFLWSLFHAILQ